MGQAKLRGTQEARTALAIAEREKLRAERENAARLREEASERIRARKWAAMSQEQRDAALKKAQQEAENYGALAGVFGHDIAGVLTSVFDKR